MVPVITSVYLGLGFLIAADNVLVICAVHSSRSLRRATNFSLVSLAVADLLVGVIALPLRTAEVLAFEWTRDVTWCRFSLCVSLLSLSASALNLLSVTAERYFAILRPLTFRSSFTCRRTCCALVFVWLSALLVSFLPLLELGKSTRGQRSHQHKICRFADTMSTEYLTFFSVTIILIPTIFMSYTYFRIFGEARKLRKRLQGLQLQDAKEEKAAFLKESKTAKTIGIVIGVFYLCWLPFEIAVVLSAFYEKLVTPTLVLFVSSLVYSNSAMNPVIYGCLNRGFRLAYKRLVPKAFLSCAKIRSRLGLTRSNFSLRNAELEQGVQGTYRNACVL